MKRALVEAVRQLVNLIADREWPAIERLTPGSSVSVSDLQRATLAYGRTFVRAPLDLQRFVDFVPAPDAISVRVPLWTEEEGRSDLELRLTAREVFGGLWSLEVDDVLVP